MKSIIPSYLFGDEYLGELKQSLLEEYVLKNICKKSECYVCKRLDEEKSKRLELIDMKLKRVEKIVLKRGMERKLRIEKMLKKGKAHDLWFAVSSIGEMSDCFDLA